MRFKGFRFRRGSRGGGACVRGHGVAFVVVGGGAGGAGGRGGGAAFGGGGGAGWGGGRGFAFEFLVHAIDGEEVLRADSVGQLGLVGGVDVEGVGDAGGGDLDGLGVVFLEGAVFQGGIEEIDDGEGEALFAAELCGRLERERAG